MKARYALLSMLIAAAAAGATPALASTEQRLDSIERKLESRGLLDMLQRIDQLQRDVQKLRGEIEMQSFTLQQLQRRQREQYLDTDRRLQQLETGRPVAPTASVPPASVSPPPAAAMQPPDGTPVAAPPASSPGSALPPSAAEQQDYDLALAILREGRYDEANMAFNKFLGSYPDSRLASNASYWLGETYYVTREFDRAETAFRDLVNRYPRSSKVSDSRLKIGYILYEKQDWAGARSELSGVVSDYPGTTAARLADNRLQRMKKEGR